MSAAGSALWPFFVAIILTVLILLIGVSAALVIGRRRLVAAHAHYVQGLLEAQDTERRHVAGEVHDGLMHRVRLLQHELDALPVPVPEALLQERLRFFRSELTDLAARARQLAHRVYPTQVESGGLGVSLRVLTEELERTTPLRVTLDAPEEGLPRGTLAHTCYRIVQEALRNVIQHAGVTEAAVTVRRTPDRLLIEVRDRGIGTRPRGEAAPSGIGVLTMQERARSQGGRLDLLAPADGGTLVRLTIPLGGAPRG